jgi:hypothetical protein
MAAQTPATALAFAGGAGHHQRLQFAVVAECLRVSGTYEEIEIEPLLAEQATTSDCRSRNPARETNRTVPTEARPVDLGIGDESGRSSSLWNRHTVPASDCSNSPFP